MDDEINNYAKVAFPMISSNNHTNASHLLCCRLVLDILGIMVKQLVNKFIPLLTRLFCLFLVGFYCRFHMSIRETTNIWLLGKKLTLEIIVAMFPDWSWLTEINFGVLPHCSCIIRRHTGVRDCESLAWSPFFECFGSKRLLQDLPLSPIVKSSIKRLSNLTLIDI